MSRVYAAHLSDETASSAKPFCVRRKALVFHKKSRPEERPLTSDAQSLRIYWGRWRNDASTVLVYAVVSRVISCLR
jgi:hypothetical protein